MKERQKLPRYKIFKKNTTTKKGKKTNRERYKMKGRERERGNRARNKIDTNKRKKESKEFCGKQRVRQKLRERQNELKIKETKKRQP
jgi:hypothetical protein